MYQSMWPPTKAEAEWMHLDRCWRLRPQDQDTGGFFVTVLLKKVWGKRRRRDSPNILHFAGDGGTRCGQA